MSERTEQLLTEIARVQLERKANWKSPDGPTYESLEANHAARIRELRAELDTLSRRIPAL